MMLDSEFQDHLVNEINRLSKEQRADVLNFVRSLSQARLRVPGKLLLRFAGTISPEDCQAMEEAIDEACERVDADEW